MAHDRYDTGQGSRGEQGRWHQDRHDEGRRHRDERGFFERAEEKISSWFGDDDDGPSRESRERNDGRSDHREAGRERGWFGRPDRDEGRNWSQRGREPIDRGGDDRQEWFGGRSGEAIGQDRSERGWYRTDSYRPERDESLSRSERERRSYSAGPDYRPVTGDYGRGSYEHADQRGRSFNERGRSFGQHESNPERDEYRRTSFAGSRERSQHHDPHYHQWRERQLQELDRDYDEYHRERQSRFEDDFGNWRERRQSKRQMLGQIREHMDVVGSDGEHVGTVDRTAGDRIILTRSDPEAGGAHHSISCTNVERVEENRVILDCTAEQTKQRWRDDDRGRALFEREDQGEMGPGMLNRSFSGTYR